MMKGIKNYDTKEHAKMSADFISNCKKLNIKPETQIENMIINFNAFCKKDITKVYIKPLTEEQIENRFKNELKNK